MSILFSQPGIDKISFTGSSATGARILDVTADRIGRVSLELGGKSAGIILGDIPVEDILATLMPGIFLMSGQVCGILSRILAPADQQMEVAEAIVGAYAKIPMGDPFLPETMMGPLVSRVQRDKVERYIKIGRDEGAKLMLGGGRPAGLERGWYVEPTVFVDVDNGMQIARDEIFGPVVVVIPYRDDDDVVAITNDSSYGLNASIFGHDERRAASIASRLQVGTVAFNSFAADPTIPYGGRKGSGFGREGGKEGFENFLETKTLVGLRPARSEAPVSPIVHEMTDGRPSAR